MYKAYKYSCGIGGGGTGCRVEGFGQPEIQGYLALKKQTPPAALGPPYDPRYIVLLQSLRRGVPCRRDRRRAAGRGSARPGSAWGFGFRDEGLGLRVEGLTCAVLVVECLVFGGWGLGFGVGLA